MSKRPIRVVTTHELPSSFPAHEFDGQIELSIARTDEDLREALHTADVLYSGHVPDTVPAEAPHLRWIQLPSAGIDFVRALPVWESDVVITSSAGMHTVPMTEHLFAMLFALVRQIPPIVRAQDQGAWIHDAGEAGLKFLELYGLTLAIVGWGKIGEGIAHVATALGMRVIGTRSSVMAPQIVEKRQVGAYRDPSWAEQQDDNLRPNTLYPAEKLHEVLGQSDVIVLILPLTKRTERLFDESAFEAVKQGALFFNIGRGGVVDETALVRALQSGKLSGAGLDVFAEEPLPASSPLWSMRNVIVSPHVGGMSERTRERTARFFGGNLKRYLRGETLLNVVDRRREY